MSDKFEVTYGNDDGYAGGHRPHRFNISVRELPDTNSKQELSSFFWDYIEDDFTRNNLKLYSEDEEEFVKWAKEQLKKQEEDV